MSAGTGDSFLRTLLVQFPHFADVPGGAALQFGMVFVFPGAGGGLDSFQLAQAHEHAFSCALREAAALTAADNSVDVLDQLLGKNHVSAFVHEVGLRPTSMLTDSVIAQEQLIRCEAAIAVKRIDGANERG